MLGEIMRKGERPPIWKLAEEAGLSRPDSDSSPGGEWLKQVWQRIENLLENWGYEEDVDWKAPLEDRIMEEADDAVPIYTHNLWEVWVDLQGYNHTEMFTRVFGDYKTDDINKIPQASLYDAAHTLLEKYTYDISGEGW